MDRYLYFYLASLALITSSCSNNSSTDKKISIELDVEKFCKSFKDINKQKQSTFDTCRKIQILKDYGIKIKIKRYYLNYTIISEKCGDYNKSIYADVYKETLGTSYKNVIESLKNNECLNKFVKNDLNLGFYDQVITTDFLLNKFRYEPESQYLNFFYEYEEFFSYPIYVIKHQTKKEVQIGCVVVVDERFHNKPAEVVSDFDCIQRI